MPPPKRGKLGALAASTNSNQDTLEQLKKDLATEGGLIKNINDARIHTRIHMSELGHTTPNDKLTMEDMAKILLSLVATTTIKRGANDRIPEKATNIIKAVALLIDDISTNSATANDKNPADVTETQEANQRLELKNQMETNVDLLKQAANSQAEATEKANTLLARMEKLHEQTIKTINEALNAHREVEKANTTYRDALSNERGTKTTTTPQTPTQFKILNRINIKARQLLIEHESGALDKILKSDQQQARPANTRIKEIINEWLSSPQDKDGPPPQNTAVKIISIFGSNRLMIEMNTSEAAEWMRTNADRILSQLLNSTVKVINRTNVIIARFVPITFEISAKNLSTFEDEADLPKGSIQHATWIKPAARRHPDQTVANMKIFCTTPEAANQLINGLIEILGSRLSIQKEIRTPGVCNKCQEYGHIVKYCTSEKDVCGLCGKDHRTSLCRERQRKCTPCRATDHPTNHKSCPIYRRYERAMREKDPENLSQYYLTPEEWTWGIKNNTDTIPPPTGYTHYN